MKNTREYGKQINGPVFSDYFPRVKNRIITNIQYRIIDFFGSLSEESTYASLFSSFARRLIGGYIYSIKLEVNDICQLKCKMCYIEPENKELALSEIYQLLDKIRRYGIRLEILGGEPLLRKDLPEIITYAKFSSGIPFISLYTNGILAEEETSKRLKAAGLDAAIVTLVSHLPGIHDDFTGVTGSWEKTISGIISLKKADIPTYTFTAVHNVNKDDVKKIYDFVHYELGVHSLFYQYVPQEKNDSLIISPLEWNRIKHWILYEKNARHMKFVRDFYMLTGNACSGGNFVLTVKADGSVQPCPFINNMPLGNIRKNDIWTIYRNRFKNASLRQFKSIPPQCMECSYKSVCGGGCKAGNDKLFGTYFHSDHRCTGPHKGKISRTELADRIPTFF